MTIPKLRLPKIKSFRKVFRRPKKMPKFLKVLLVFLALLSLGLIIAIVTLFRDLPSPKKLSAGNYPVSTQIFDRHGSLLYEIYADTHRTPITLQNLPAYVPQATISIEDQNFYSHFGFSIQGIIRAAKNTLFKNKLQGGSTITQQLVKTALLTPERTLQRKIREAVLTVGTEIMYSKDQIMEMYLNHIPYGGTAYGIEAAAQRFFGKPAKNLSLAEATLLVGLPQAPSRFSPFTNPENAKARQHEVLRRMVEEGYVSQTEADQAFATPLQYAPPETDIRAPHFVFYIKDLLVEKYGLQQVERGGLRVTTSLDLDLQEYAQSSVSAEIDKLEKYRVSNGAALVTKPNTGEVLAMIGSRDYFDTDHDGQVNLAIRLRQPGSSIKPINYVTGLQTGTIAPGTTLLDYPTCFQVGVQASYCPKNYDGSFHGPTKIRTALANSYNIPAVKILALNGLESMIATASAMGITTFTDTSRYGYALTLGGGEVKMVEMATAFGTLANQGVKVPLHPILKVTDYQGKVLEEYQPEVTQQNLSLFFEEDNPSANTVSQQYEGLTRVLNREPAYVISDMLSDNSARAPAFGTNSELNIRGKTVSVKTGTTNDLRDNWTIGYTPQFLVVTWVGNNDNKPMNPYVVSGVTGAAPIWHDIMSYLIKDIDNDDLKQPKPSTITTKFSCTQPNPDDPNAQCQGASELSWDLAPTPQPATTKKNIWVFKDTNKPAFIGNTKPEEVDTSNLELKEHTIAVDPFTPEYCLDCDYTNPEDGKSNYPSITVKITDVFQPFTPLTQTENN